MNLFASLGQIHNSQSGKNIDLNIIEENGVYYIPLYLFSKNLNLDFNYDFLSQKAVIQHNQFIFQVTPESPYLYCNGEIYSAVNSAILYNSRLYIPVSMATRIIKLIQFDHLSLLVPEDKKIQNETDDVPQVAIVPTKKTPQQNISHIKKTEQPRLKKRIISNSGKNSIKFIVLDAGHGGKDPGGIGVRGLREKIVVLKVAKYVNNLLASQLPGVKIVLTRKDNTFISLKRRTVIANKNLKKYKHGLFVAIHANISRNKKTYGYETFYLSDNPTDDEARAVAALENGVINPKETKLNSVNKILSGMLDTELIRQSQTLATFVDEGYKKNLTPLSISRGIKTARFYVLEGSMMPAILTEIGFLSNYSEEKRLRQEAYLKKVSKGIADGIINFVKYYNNANGFTS